MSFLPGMNPGFFVATVAAGGAVTKTFTDSFATFTSDTYTDTGASIGTAAADRLVFVTISGVSAGGTVVPTAVTVGGISATLAADIDVTSGSGDQLFSQVWWAAVPTGTTANIVLTFTGGTIAFGGSVYSVTGADTTTPVDSFNTANVASGAVSASITPPNGSATIATAFCGIDLSDLDITWTNITEDVDQSVNVGIFALMGSASREDVTSPGSISVTANSAAANVPEKTLAVVALQVP